MRKYYRLLVLLIVSVLAFGLVGCTNSKADASGDVLTQKGLSEDKIPITVMVKYAFSINTFEAAVEKKFPNIDIVQVGNYTSDMGIAEYDARMTHDDLTDIVMTWPVDVGEEYWEDRLIDLSSLSLTSKYTTSMLDNISRDGKLYYLPGPSQVRGIIYNKTLFNEKGWQVPTDFNSFVNLCKEIESSGMRSLQLGLGNSEVLDTAFVGYGFESSYSQPQNAKMIKEYNAGKGSFGDNYMPALNTFQTLIDEGILKKEDLSVMYQDREHMMFTRQCAMIEDSVLMARMGETVTGSTDEFALMPFFNPGVNSDWSRLYPVCYIGLNKELENSKNKEKYDLVMELLDYISTPEGQKALAGDTGAMFSSLNGVAPPDDPEIEKLLPSLTHGRFAIFPTLENAQAALRKGLAGMVAGELTSEDVIKMVDAENASPPVEEKSSVLGTASADFSLTETANFITDAMRSQSGCEIALFMDNGKDGKYNGKGVSGKFYEGDITTIDVKRVLPDLKHEEKGELWKITMTGKDLINTLEYSIPVDNNIGGWFYYFSGLKMEYDPCAQPGSRIKNITDEKGNKIDSKKLYSIAVMDYTVDDEYLASCDKTGILINDIVSNAIEKEKKVSPSNDGRFILTSPYSTEVKAE